MVGEVGVEGGRCRDHLQSRFVRFFFPLVCLREWKDVLLCYIHGLALLFCMKAFSSLK